MKFLLFADLIYLQSFIPKTLEQVKDAEEDAFRLTSGKDTGDMYYKTITGLKGALSMTQASVQQKDLPKGDEEPTPSESDSETGSEDGDEDESSSVSEEGEEPSRTKKLGPEDKKAARKENKKKVKEEKREARKTKIPKAVKKRKKKLAKAHKTR